MKIAAAAMAAFTLGLTVVSSVAWGQASEFYKGKQVKLVVGNAAGGDYDLGARTLARHMGRHLPGVPSIVVQNMPGASGNNSATFLYSVAPKDGTVFGSFSRNLPSQAALGRMKTIDPRLFAWIGATSLPSRICVSSQTSEVKTAEDVFNKELIVGSTGLNSVQSIVPSVLNKIVGTKFPVVEGYRGIGEIMIALERGEVQGVCHLLSVFEGTYADMLQQGKIRPLFNVEDAAIDSLPDMPSIYAYAKDEESKQFLRFVFSSAEFGRPYAAPPGTAEPRVAELRKAFAAALADRELVAEANKIKLDMKYRSATDLATLTNALFATSPDLLKRIDELLPEARD